jgi:hypothetical protein
VIAVASSANRDKANLVMSSGVVEAMRVGSESNIWMMRFQAWIEICRSPQGPFGKAKRISLGGRINNCSKSEQGLEPGENAGALT